jgi:hypothetical protein
MNNSMPRLRRDIAKATTTRAHAEQSQQPVSPETGLSMVWDLTREVYSLSGKYDVERRLSRDAVIVIRR